MLPVVHWLHLPWSSCSYCWCFLRFRAKKVRPFRAENTAKQPLFARPSAPILPSNSRVWVDTFACQITPMIATLALSCWLVTATRKFVYEIKTWRQMGLQNGEFWLANWDTDTSDELHWRLLSGDQRLGCVRGKLHASRLASGTGASPIGLALDLTRSLNTGFLRFEIWKDVFWWQKLHSKNLPWAFKNWFCP